MKSMKDLSAEERPKFGAAVNEIKSQIAAAIESKWAELEAKEMEDRLEREKIDITLDINDSLATDNGAVFFIVFF